ncbi:vesicle-associated protein 1-2-like [Rhodamnia argentea]|uniref:Vesicle-associated protein 1-2-like n=1 Tax=Rhodamnia argentea TaxID=178133 RepID=A0ABM3HXZ3_9MYRT|nr:vesicle-associated protein 1-2-like [Rhodamnia argentea]
MSTGDLLRNEPQELQFPLELRKLISCSLRLSNETDNYVAFEVMRTNQEKYWVRPCTGIVLPRSTGDVKVTMDALMEAPLDMQCKIKFLVRSVTASPGSAAKDITREMVIEINLAVLVAVGYQFNEVPGRKVEECKMMVVYVAPPRPSSQVREGSSPGASISDSKDLNNLEFTAVSARYILASIVICNKP